SDGKTYRLLIAKSNWSKSDWEKLRALLEKLESSGHWEIMTRVLTPDWPWQRRSSGTSRGRGWSITSPIGNHAGLSRSAALVALSLSIALREEYTRHITTLCGP